VKLVYLNNKMSDRKFLSSQLSGSVMCGLKSLQHSVYRQINKTVNHHWLSSDAAIKLDSIF